MHKLSSFVFTIFAAVLGCIPLQGVAADEATLVVSSFTVNPLSNPFSRNQGLCTNIVKQAFLTQNANIQVAYSSFKEAIANVLNNRAVGVFPLYKTGELDQSFFLSEPLYTLKMRLYRQKVSRYEEQLSGDPESISTHKACISSEFAKLPILTSIASQYGVEIESKDYVQECYAGLSNGAFDFMIDEASNFTILSSNVFIDFTNIEAIPNAEYDIPVYFAVNSTLSGGQDLIASFNQGLKTLQETGKIQSIKQEHNNFYHII